jgi:hypothetical protein
VLKSDIQAIINLNNAYLNLHPFLLKTLDRTAHDSMLQPETGIIYPASFIQTEYLVTPTERGCTFLVHSSCSRKAFLAPSSIMFFLVPAVLVRCFRFVLPVGLGDVLVFSCSLLE